MCDTYLNTLNNSPFTGSTFSPLAETGRFPSSINVTKKPIDSSERKSLIYIGATGVPSGLRPALGGEGQRENVQTESKT
jgi:hypothetical protein